MDYSEDAEDDLISNEGKKKMFTREVKKDVKDEPEADYYNQWIMSNVGWRKYTFISDWEWITYIIAYRLGQDSCCIYFMKYIQSKIYFKS